MGRQQSERHSAPEDCDGGQVRCGTIVRIFARPPLNLCIHCGKQHDPQTQTCPVTGKSLAVTGNAHKTIFGVAPPLPVPTASASVPAGPSGAGNRTIFGVAAPSPLTAPRASTSLPPPAPRPSAGLPVPAPSSSPPPASVRPSASVPLVAPPPPPPPKLRAPDLEKTPAVVLSAPIVAPAPKPMGPARTMLMINPTMAKAQGVPSASPAAPSEPPAARPKGTLSPPPTPAQEEVPTRPSRLPTSDEARHNPELVVSLDTQPADPLAPTRMAAPLPTAAATPAVDDLELELPPRPASVAPPTRTVESPSPDGPARPPSAKPCAPPLASAPDRDSEPRPARAASRGLGGDLKDAIRCLVESATDYRARWQRLLILTAALMLPAMAIESCLNTALMGSLVAKPAISANDTALAQRYGELRARLEESRAKGHLDQQVLAELAALEPVMAAGAAAQLSVPSAPSRVASSVLRFLASLLSGLLIFGLAVPLAYAAGALAAADHLSGAATPEWADLWPILKRRGDLFLFALLAVAGIVALGYALFVLPGLVASVLLVFVPHVVLFEKRPAKAALLRSLDLVKGDPIRVCLVLLASMVASGIVYKLADLLIPDSGRPLLFVQGLLGSLLFVAAMPIFTGALGRLYVELRQREGASAEELARAARR